MAEDYQKILDDLRTGKLKEYDVEMDHGKLKEYDVEMDHFMEFQHVLMNYQYKKSIVGEAKRGGGAVYHFDDGSHSNN